MFLLILLLLVLLVLIVLLLLVLILILILVLILLLSLAELQVVARLIVSRIVAQRLLIGLDGLAEHLVLLTHHTHIMIGLGTTQWIGLELGSSLQLGDGQRVLALSHQGITQVVVSLGVALVLLHGLAVRHLGISSIALAELLVALTYQVAVSLGIRGEW